jgi:hypothetical protein
LCRRRSSRESPIRGMRKPGGTPQFPASLRVYLRTDGAGGGCTGNKGRGHRPQFCLGPSRPRQGDEPAPSSVMQASADLPPGIRLVSSVLSGSWGSGNFGLRRLDVFDPRYHSAVGTTERRRSYEDEIEQTRAEGLAFLRKFSVRAASSLNRLPKRSGLASFAAPLEVQRSERLRSPG